MTYAFERASFNNQITYHQLTILLYRLRHETLFYNLTFSTPFANNGRYRAYKKTATLGFHLYARME